MVPSAMKGKGIGGVRDRRVSISAHTSVIDDGKSSHTYFELPVSENSLVSCSAASEPEQENVAPKNLLPAIADKTDVTDSDTSIAIKPFSSKRIKSTEIINISKDMSAKYENDQEQDTPIDLPDVKKSDFLVVAPSSSISRRSSVSSGRPMTKYEMAKLQDDKRKMIHAKKSNASLYSKNGGSRSSMTSTGSESVSSIDGRDQGMAKNWQKLWGPSYMRCAG
jgi:hypothetical protein